MYFLKTRDEKVLTLNWGPLKLDVETTWSSKSCIKL